eukprot:4557255-Pyramimonas_sp.AAC.1
MDGPRQQQARNSTAIHTHYKFLLPVLPRPLARLVRLPAGLWRPPQPEVVGRARRAYAFCSRS